MRDAISDWLCGQYLKGEDRQEGLVWEYEQKRLVPGFTLVKSPLNDRRKRPDEPCAQEHA